MQSVPSNGGPSRGEGPKKDVAIYVDYENLYISLRSTVGQNPNFDVIMEKCREFGRVTVARAYADWSEFARVVTSQMFASGIEPIYVPTRRFYDARTRAQATKNSVDIHITIDIMRTVLSGQNVDTFVLVSGDRDFVPLMNQIRAAGKEVYAIGVAGCTSSELAVAVDEMFYYHQLLESEEEMAAEQRDIYAKLVRAIEVARARGYRATLGVVKPIMREIVGGFDERKLRNGKGVPYQKFKQFVQDAERGGFLRVRNTADGVELFLAKDGPDAGRPEEAAAGRARETRGRRGDDRAEPVAAAGAAGADGDSSEAAGAESPEASGGSGEGLAAAGTGSRRRGRRGGRSRRGRGRVAGEALASPGAAGPEGGAEDLGDGDRDAAVDAAPRPGRGPEEVSLEEVAPARLVEDEDEAADGQGPPLPGEALEDLQYVMGTFKDRAPSQRLVIARLKKGAAGGELKGDYHEGQFLRLVQGAVRAGRLVKVTKRFSSGLRWAGDEGAAAAETEA